MTAGIESIGSRAALLATSRVALAACVVALLVASGRDSAAEAGPRATVAVEVTGLRSESGRVGVLLFDQADGYPSEPARALRKGWAPIRAGKAVVVFKALEFGTYAAFAFHDEDGNGVVRTNIIGMPTEGVGASNRAKGRMGPPRFKAASFEVASEQKVVPIVLRYL